MFTTLVSVLALSALAPSVFAAPSHNVRPAHRAVASQIKERGYAKDEDLLEPYASYAERYQLFGCENQHNSTFWDGCCHPLLRNEPESALPDSCWANVTDCSETTSIAGPTSTYIPPPATTSSVKAHTEPATSAHTEPATSIPAPPVTTHVAPTTSHKAAPPATTSVSSGGGGGGSGGNWRTGGFGTYFYQGGNAGACGTVHSDSTKLVAIDIHYYGNTGEVSKYCGKTVRIVNTDNGKTVDAVVADVCPTCVNDNCLDMSVGTFQALSELSVGMFPIKYQILD